MNIFFFRFFLTFYSIYGQGIDPSSLEGLLRGDLVYVECRIDQMCAYMSESWLESEEIYESDTPYLTLQDRIWFFNIW